MKPVRRFRLEHGGNIRDLGGYEAADGRVTQFGKLLRGGSLHNLTAEEWDRLISYGLRTVLDLRSQAEISLHPDCVPEGIAWFHCPLQRAEIDAADLTASAERAFAGSLTEGYRKTVHENGDLLAAALKTLTAGLEQGTVLFHCTAGKDRTGILASAVLQLCGVSPEDITADYQVSYTYLKKGTERMLSLLDAETREKMAPYMRSEAWHMEQLLAYYEETRLAEYLETYGFTGQDAERLRERVLG